MQLREDAAFMDILKIVDGNKDVAPANKVFKEYFCVAALFLRLKKDFENGLEYGKEYYGKQIPELYSVLRAFGEDNLKLALYLLGLTLGWDNTYQYIYKLRGLAVLL